MMLRKRTSQHCAGIWNGHLQDRKSCLPFIHRQSINLISEECLILPFSNSLKVVMAKQNYLCAGCGMKVEPEYSYIFRYCNYLGRYFCTACHSNKTFVIPSRIFKKWDFRKWVSLKIWRSKQFSMSHWFRYPVSNFSFDLLERMWFDPLFRLGYINPLLYRRCKQLNKVLELRVQLIHVAEFLRVCRFAEEYVWFTFHRWFDDQSISPGCGTTYKTMPTTGLKTLNSILCTTLQGWIRES